MAFDIDNSEREERATAEKRAAEGAGALEVTNSIKRQRDNRLSDNVTLRSWQKFV